ncbi:hypothetical protein BS50DRAFT_615414 [Corynespora cassiicola Philippines]|uniref:Uncharacterized protein n=1 Tax=Corynespora cassiicola Philippines TaxID=1448308 RepID=A0A2T2PA69_CORCC|nr:hypothetical protein BS50DRAFT_615414 [Corynespora cassiicola Philippines]
MTSVRNFGAITSKYITLWQYRNSSTLFFLHHSIQPTKPMGSSFSSEVEGECQKKNFTLNCELGWGMSADGTLNVTRVGKFEHGEFPANGDLAGIGTLLAFIIPTSISMIIGLIMLCGMGTHIKGGKAGALTTMGKYTPSPHGEARCRRSHRSRSAYITEESAPKETKNEQWYDLFESILMLTSDSQMVLGIALCINFALVGKCSISMYHFQMGVNILVITCANALLTLVLIRDYWRTPLSAVVRLTAFGMILYFLGEILRALHHREEEIGAAERLPPSDRMNSLILLGAACFLDPDPLKKLALISDQQAQSVGRLTKDTIWSSERVLWLLIVGGSILAFLYRVGDLVRPFWKVRRDEHAYDIMEKKASSRWWPIFCFWVCAITWLLCIVTTVWQGNYLFSLREWVFNSGWMKSDEYLGNEEAHAATFGQLAALFAMTGMVIMAFDQWELKSKR